MLKFRDYFQRSPEKDPKDGIKKKKEKKPGFVLGQPELDPRAEGGNSTPETPPIIDMDSPNPSSSPSTTPTERTPFHLRPLNPSSGSTRGGRSGGRTGGGNKS